MGNNNIDVLEQVIKDKFEGFYLSEKEMDSLRTVLLFHAFSQPKFPGTHMNILLISEDSIRTKDFTDRLVSSLGELLGIGNLGIRIPESELIRNPNIIKKHLGNKQVFVITDCKETEPSNWSEIREAYESNPKDLKIICVEKDIENLRFKKDDHLYYRVLNKKIYLRDYSANDAIESLYSIINNNKYKMIITDDFRTGIVDYINTVYPKADLRRELFVKDAFNRIVIQLGEDALAEGEITLTSKHIPFFFKDNSNENEVPGNNSVIDDKKDNKLSKSLEDYIEEYYGKTEKIVEKKKTNINVALFAYSDLGNKIEESKVNLDGDKGYYYQLEPVLINAKSKMGKNGLDYIIGLSTHKTNVVKHTIFKHEIYNYEFDESPVGLIEKIATLGNVINIEPMSSTTLEEISSLNYTKMDNSRIIVVDVDTLIDGKYLITDNSIAKAIHDTISIIRAIETEGNVALNYYNNGGFREIPIYLETIMSLIREDSGVEIIKNVVEYTRGETTIVKEGHLGIADFVSGINEFRNYCKIDSLKKYYHDRMDYQYNSISETDKKFIKCLEHISYGIQLNNLQTFENGLLDLKEIDKLNSKDNYLNDQYLNLFYSEIINDFYFLNQSGSEYTVGMIKWSYEKGYYQQVLTMIESLAPQILFDSGIFKYDYSEYEINRIKKYNNQDAVNVVFNEIVCLYLLAVPKKRASTLLSEGIESESFSSFVEEKKREFNAYKLVTDNDFYRNGFTLKIYGEGMFEYLSKHRYLKKLRNNSNHLNKIKGEYGKYKKDLDEIKNLKKNISEYIHMIKKVIDDPVNNQIIVTKHRNLIL